MTQFVAPAVKADPDRANVVRQAMAGMLWRKQYYYFDGYRWLDGHRANPLSATSRQNRNRDWFHMINDDILSMPDKWEYPWYAAWDLAFHALALSVVDLDFAKEQLQIILSGRYMHPNGQVPAYEWNFSDVNPPVHAWATLFLYRTEQALRGAGDLEFLKSVFSKLMINFTWWVNRKDRFGKNVFEGGFLGSIISASSIAALRCPPAGISSRRTVRRGCACSVRTWPSSPPSLAATTRRTTTLSQSLSITFCGLRGG